MNFTTAENIILHHDLDPDINLFNRIYPGINSNYDSKYYDLALINQTCSKSNCDFALVHLNVRSIFNKIDEFISMISVFNFTFDVICFSESWLDDHSKNLVSIPGYVDYHSLRPVGKKGGGVSYVCEKSF